MKILHAALAASIALVAATQAQAITYTGTRTVGTGIANLSITTDDTIGILSTANITAFSITVSNAFGSFDINDTNGAVLVLGDGLAATATDLTYDFGGSDGFALFQAPAIGSGQTFYCIEATACAGNPGGETLLPDNNYNDHRSFATFAGVEVIATAAAAAVPEPATWGMMLLGFGMVGAAARRSRRTPVAA